MDTAEELREQAREQFVAAHESFERCDTDGFLTQWAHGIEGRRLQYAAEIAENNGRWQFFGLYHGDRRVAAREIRTRYGMRWILRDDEATRYGKKFLPIVLSVGTQSRAQKALGLSERMEWAPAVAKIVGSGYGLSGSAWAAIVRTDDKEWGLGSDLVKEDGK